MKLVEAEAEGPVEGDEAIVTPPRPPHRRVSVSIIFTLLVLVGTVVSIYVAFPARDNVLVTEALENHRVPPPWDLVAPGTSELRAWAIGAAGPDVPVPATAIAIGAKRIDIHDRHAALMRLKIGANEVTYLVQHARGISPDHSERMDHDLHAVEWRHGPFTCVAVGPEATYKTWLAAFTPG